MKLFSGIVFMAVFSLVFAGCSQVPKEAIDAAIKAREDAQAIEADVYAKDSFAAAEKIMTELNAEIEGKSLENTEQLALDAKKAFAKAAIDAQNEKDKLSGDIPGLVERATDDLQAVEELYAKNKAALKAKKVDLNALVSDLQALKNVLMEAQTDGKTSKLMDAKIKLDGVLAKLSENEQTMRKALDK